MAKVVILMGSKGDLEHCRKIAAKLKQFGVESILRVASAHKVPMKALAIIKQYESVADLFITVAGRSNALSGFVDAHTPKPVIACPPYSDKFSGADIFSSLRMPSGVCPLVVLEPEQAALAAVKIVAVADKALQIKITQFQQSKQQQLEQDDQEVLQHG